jgi:glycosyltransferase involved in cell wall biosynthesis
VPRLGVLITAFDQGGMIREAVDSVQAQTLVPDRILVVDDGSEDPGSVRVLDALAARSGVIVVHQPNSGVSAARNRGLAECADCRYVTVLDGDDRLAPEFLERTVASLDSDPDVLGASSWMRMFGTAHALVAPSGGDATAFLARNACPATVTLRRDAWAATPGYDEQMRSGFEDWDFFLTLLADGGRIEIVPEPLIEYRTAPASSNVTSMGRRSELFGRLVDRHSRLYRDHAREALVALDALSSAHLREWELAALDTPGLALDRASFGDGGMAAVVRVATARARRER